MPCRGGATEIAAAAEEEEAEYEEVEGWRLRLNPSSKTGYVGVSQSGQRFSAAFSEAGQTISLGSYATAVEAAIAVAKYEAGDEKLLAKYADRGAFDAWIAAGLALPPPPRTATNER